MREILFGIIIGLIIGTAYTSVEINRNVTQILVKVANIEKQIGGAP